MNKDTSFIPAATYQARHGDFIPAGTEGGEGFKPQTFDGFTKHTGKAFISSDWVAQPGAMFSPDEIGEK